MGGFVYSASSGEYLHSLTPSDGSRIITTSVDNGRLLAGTLLSSVDGLSRVGQAFLSDIVTGQELPRFGPILIDEEGRFGSAVSLLGALALIGAPSTFSTSGPPNYSSGEAYLRNVETGKLPGLLQASALKPEDYFGWSVALGENRAAVGALDPASGLPNAGAVFPYDLSTIPEPAVIGWFFNAVGFGLLLRRHPRESALKVARCDQLSRRRVLAKSPTPSREPIANADEVSGTADTPRVCDSTRNNTASEPGRI